MALSFLSRGLTSAAYSSKILSVGYVENMNKYIKQHEKSKNKMAKQYVLGIESTALTFGIGIVQGGRIIVNVKDSYATDKGGIIPTEAAKHHAAVRGEVLKKALEEAKINEREISAIAFSRAPGLAPCLLEGLKFI